MERSSRNFQPSSSNRKFQAIFPPPNRYFTENSRQVPPACSLPFRLIWFRSKTKPPDFQPAKTWQASAFSLAARKLERQPNADRLSGGLLRCFLGSRWSSRGSGVEELSEWEVGVCLFSPLFSLLSSSFTLLILDE